MYRAWGSFLWRGPALFNNLHTAIRSRPPIADLSEFFVYFAADEGAAKYAFNVSRLGVAGLAELMQQDVIADGDDANATVHYQGCRRFRLKSTVANFYLRVAIT
jgi:hypothetical protein